MSRKPNRLLAVSLTGLFLGLLLAQFPLLHQGHSDTAIVVIANDSTNGASSLATEGGQKLIEDSFGRIIAVYVDSSGRLAVTYANSNPSLAGSWAAPSKSPPPSSAYSKPASILTSLTSLRIIAQGGTGLSHINDQNVTIQRDSSQNIVGVSFGNSTQLDGSGKAKHPAATIAHNGDILAAWNWESGNSSRVKALRWRAGVGWTSFNGFSTLPDDVIVDNSDDGEIFPGIIQRKDNHHVYLIGNREEDHPSTTLVFNKATFEGSDWSWETQNLNYESNAARGISDSTSLTWDPVQNRVVAAYDVSDSTIYGVFTLDASDQKTYIFTPSLIMTNNEWGSIEVDETTGDYYLFTMNTSIGRNYGMLGYTKRVGNAWNSSLTILDPNTNNVAVSVKRIGSSTSIDLLYTRTITDSVSQLRFVRISTGPLPSTRPSDITISAQPNPSNDTDSTTISGTLTDGLNGTALHGQTVMIEQSLDQSNWLLITQTTTATDGSYQTSFTFPPGTYYFRAVFPGNIAYESSVSVTYQQIVQAEFPRSYAIVGDQDGKVYRLMDRMEGSLSLIGQPTTNPLRRIAWRPGGAYALIVGQAATLLKYDGNQFTPIATGLPSSVNLLSVAWKPDGSYALIAGSSGTVLKYDGISAIAISSPVTVSIRSISWRPDGASALLVGDVGTMLVYQNDLLTTFPSGTSSALWAVAWNPNGQYALVAGANGTIIRHNGVSNALINTTGIYQPSHVVLAVGWNSTGNIALLSGQTGLVLTYDGASLFRLPTVTLTDLHSLDWSAWWANIVGGQGTVLKFFGSTLQQVSSGVTSSLRAIDWTEPATGLDHVPPSQPQNLTATAAGISRIDISWTMSEDNVAVWGYDVFRNGVKIARVAGALASYSDNFVVLATTYTYNVIAFDAEGNLSFPSEALSVMILFFNSTDDATIRLTKPNNNFGFLDELEVDNSPVDQFLIKFNVTGITAGQVASAIVRLRNTNDSPKGGNFYTTTSASWTEISVTWNTAPANQTLVASLGQVSPGNWYELDITSIVTGNGVVSLRASSTSSDGADYSSGEGANPPELLVTVVNKPPQIAPLGNKAVAEESFLGFNATATDPDNDPLSFSLGPGAPTGAGMTPAGVFSWTPSETQGPGSYPITITVSDGVLTDSETITVTVNEVNKAPILDSIGDREINEGESLSFTVNATDPDTPLNAVTLSISGSAPGASFNPATGAFTWTPGEGQGPGVFTVAFAAADNGSPILADNETITITVNEVNQPPLLIVPGSQAVNEGSTVTFTVSTSDPDIPANSITLSATGLPSGASFNPSTGSFSWTPTLGQRGTYTITFTATDNGSPPYSDPQNVTITVSPAPLQASFSSSLGTAGKPTGFNATASGGTPPYSFAWNFGDGSSGSGATVSHSYAVKGSYNVTLTVTDSGNATRTVSQLVTVSPQPLVVTVVSSSTTAGKPVNFTAVANGGTTPYVISWSFGDDFSASGNPVFHAYSVKGSYPVNVILTDANNASASASIIVNVGPQPLGVSITASAPASVGSPVSFNSTVTGGTTPYSSSWNFGDGSTGSGGSTTHTYTVKGTYTVVVNVTDANGVSANATMTLNVGGLPLTASFTMGPATAGKPASFNATASGGTGPYSFTWSFGDGTGRVTGATVSHVYAVKGSYNVTVTVTDSNGSTATASRVVSVAPQPIVASVSVSAASAGKPANLTASVSGGTAPYTFAWDFGDNSTGSGTPVSHTYPVKGTYTVKARVTDANNATVQATASVTVQPQPLTVAANCGQATSGKPVSCVASGSGGTTPYAFTWDVGNDTTVDGSGSSFTTIFAVKGSYLIRVGATDANGVIAGTSLLVIISAQPLTVDFAVSTPRLTGQPVNFTAVSSGGTAPYTFAWDFGDGTSGSGQETSHTYSVKGKYNVTLTLTDANNATTSVSRVFGVSLQLPAITAACDNGTAGKPLTCSSSVSGGTSPYSFSWAFSDGGTGSGPSVNHTFTVKGTYSVTVNVTDANLASASASVQVIVSPQALQAEFVFTPSSPTAGKPVNFSATATGGTTPYTFHWAFGDGTVESGSSVVHSYVVKGSYMVTVNITDANGSMVSVARVIVVSPQPLAVSITSSPSTAGKPANLTATVSGGTGPYAVSWSFGDASSGTGNPVSHSYAVKGTYNVTVTVSDVNNATASGNTIINVSAQPLTAVISVGDATAGKPTIISVTVSGGTAPYTVSWDFGDSSVGIGDTVSHVYNVKGSYIVAANVTDSNSASIMASMTVSVTPQPLVVTASCGPATAGKPVTCNATASGGTSPYLVSWDVGKDGTIDGQGETLTTVFPVKGTYSIDSIVWDANNASARVNLLVAVESQPLAAIISSSTATAGKPVDFSAVISGGTGPYSVQWTFGGGTNATGNPVSHTYPVKGSYNVTISLTDANGKSANSTATIIVSPQPPTVTAQCSNGTAGKPINCNATASGGTSPYTFYWSFSDNTTATGSDVSHTFAVKGSYTATVTASDVNGAVANSTITVSIAPQPFLADFTMNAGTVLVGENLVLAATASGGTPPYLFSWDFGDGLTAAGGNVVHAYSVKGSYTITLNATDVNGAVSTATKTVTVLPLPLTISGVNLVPAQTSVGDSATFTATMTGGTAPYAVVWDLNGDNVSDAQGNPVDWVYSSAQNVTVSVYARDANNATSTVVSTTITVVPFPISEFRFDWADYNNNGKVDIIDVASAAACFDATSSSPAWSSCAFWDFDLDSKVGILDIALLASWFDRTIASPFPGEGHAAGIIDPQWHAYCYLLSSMDRAYCESRPD